MCRRNEALIKFKGAVESGENILKNLRLKDELDESQSKVKVSATVYEIITKFQRNTVIGYD